MRIIASKFKDYYDTAMGLGVDKTLVYVRKSQYLEYVDKVMVGTVVGAEDRTYGPLAHRVEVTIGTVGFCGVFYPFVRFTRCHPYPIPRQIEYAYDIKQYEELLERWPMPDEYKHYWNGHPLVRPYANPEQFFEQALKRTDDPFFKARAPILLPLRDHGRLWTETNVCLRDLQFYRVFDAYKTYQEISMYLGGVLSSAGKEMITLSDEMKRDKHGFDEKSFKTVTPGKKHRRRNRSS